jgi:hypothetical protein
VAAEWCLVSGERDAVWVALHVSIGSLPAAICRVIVTEDHLEISDFGLCKDIVQACIKPISFVVKNEY